MNRIVWAVCCGLWMVMISGCDDQEISSAKSSKRPRPVTAFRLRSWDPVESDLISGTAASWKTEDIGFEVSGRVSFVVEPETDIDGQMFDAQGKVLTVGTELAWLASQRYKIRVQGSEAQVEAAREQKASVEIEATKVIPAKLRAAIARQNQLKNEFTRVNRLFEQKVATREQFDVAVANTDSADAEVEQIRASQEAKNAEVKALDAAIKQANQVLAEAERDLADCILKAPFPGQIAKVHVIPGANVKPGTSVVTVQMMTPMKVEFEVSRDVAKSLNYNERLPIRIPTPSGDPLKTTGLVYLTDTTADPLSRTYTVTLMVRNQQTGNAVPEDLDLQGQPVWKTRMLWPLRRLAKLAAGSLAVDVNAVHQDGQGAFVWKVQNRTINQTGPTQSNVLQVVRLPV
ncbi:MAG: HlyD family efflux transporter periplasmic adaptor subunit, partial [Planctomycetaceae bacterium]